MWPVGGGFCNISPGSFGVCAGAQLIASAYGVAFKQLPARTSGPRAIRLTDNSLRFALGGCPSAMVAERHGWAIADVHSRLVSYVESETGVEVLKHRWRPLLGLQFHPEIQSPDGRAIFSWAVSQVLVADIAEPLS